LLKCGIGDFTLYLRPVGLGQLPARLGDAGLQGAVVGQQQQPFGVKVQAACRVEAAPMDEFRQGALVAFRTELANDLIRFVEQQYAWHGPGPGKIPSEASILTANPCGASTFCNRQGRRGKYFCDGQLKLAARKRYTRRRPAGYHPAGTVYVSAPCEGVPA
jgi:hypothetical protein